jgi:hypothetical protein
MWSLMFSKLGIEGVVTVDPVPVLLDVAGVHHQDVVVVVAVLHVVHQQVVHDAALVVGQAAVLHLAGGELGGVVAGDLLDEVQGLGPRTRNSPMWLTSNTPTALRTVRCSSFTPLYCTGMR